MKRAVATLGSMIAAAAVLSGGGAVTWESTTYTDFLRGRFSGLSLTKDGRITLAPRLDAVLNTDQIALWSVATAPDGTIYAGTGHRGRIYRIDKDGKASIYWTAEQPEVFALAVDSRGILHAGTSPDGKIYRIENGKATELFDPKSRYIWALLFGPDGALYIGTGDNGRIFRVARDAAEVWYESGQAHITSLAMDPQGRLLAGSEPNGLLYRIEQKGKAFVLYDANLPEIRSIMTGPDGSIYAAALGGSLVRQQAQAAAAGAATNAPGTVPAVSTSITVTAENAQAGLELRPKADPAKPAQTATDTTLLAQQPVVDLTGVEKAAIYRIAPDNTVDTLWSSKEENVYDLAQSGSDLLFSTDLRGRIYRLSPDQKTTLLLETREGETTRLSPVPGGWFAATSNLAKLFRMGSQPGEAGRYESPVHDAGGVARWGRLSWRADLNGGKIAFRTRSGNSMRPDDTWSAWSDPITDEKQSNVASPNARYVQWAVEVNGTNGASPVLDSVALTYLPQNNRPVVRSISVSPVWSAMQQPKAAPPAQQNLAYSITVTETGDAVPGTSSGTPTQSLNRTGNQQLVISWQADDPDGDRLIYNLWFRGEGESEWKLIRNQLTDNSYTIEAEAFADGRYFFRVEASDRLANTTGQTRTAELVSQPVFVDNTPPRMEIGQALRTNGVIEVEAAALDAASPLRRAEYSVDAGPWLMLEPEDGILDSLQERFRLRVRNLAEGEHIIVIRVFDSAGNPGLAKAVVR